ncbi:MAG: DUF4011 domain-containing protein, partial [Ilumatobacteraceae bacterium]
MTLARLLGEALAADGLPSTGDVIAVSLPFLRDIGALHHDGLVASLRGAGSIEYDGSAVRLASSVGQAPRRHDAILRRLDPERPVSGVEVTSRLDLDTGDGDRRTVMSLDVFDDESGAPDRPMFVVGYRAWEQWHDHHDELTDIHIAGQVIATYALGLDLDLPAAVHELAVRSRRIGTLNPHLHPVVAGVLSEMLSPERHRRPPDLVDVIARLEHHRELPADLDLTEAYRSDGGWQDAVLGILRERVFDVSRRNRALYFRPTANTVSLTEASVPLLLDVQRVRTVDLLTWSGAGADALRSGRPVDLEQWCRFEEAPHLAPSLDTLITNERKLRAEHGHGRLLLIAAFLRWVEPDTGDVVSSPLLTSPVELRRRKGVRDRYVVQIDGDRLDVNPVLRHVFRSRFGVSMPEHIDGDHDSIVALVGDLETAVRSTDPSVRIELVDTPRVTLIRRRAQLRVDAYRRRRAQAAVNQGRWRRQDHSYDHDDWRPLGLALYRRFVRPTELPMRLLGGAPPRPLGPQAMAASARSGSAGMERQQTSYSVSTGDVHAHRWEVDLCAVTLASLGSRRTNLVRDYDSVLRKRADGTNGDDPQPAMTSFEAIFTPDPRAATVEPVTPFSIDQPLVLPADDAQAQAVRRAVGGQSFIVQGPPGTGKSQTITNLIANLVAEGKRVLFVCEKRAALDVVAHRLQQVGLGELVVIVHDSQLDRRAVITDLGATYEKWLDAGDDDRVVRREAALAAVREILDPLERTFVELTDARGGRSSLASLVERLVQLRAQDVGVAPSLPPDLDKSTWAAARPSIDRVVAEMAAAGHHAPLGRCAPLRMAPGRLVDTDPIVVTRDVGSALVRAVSALDAALAARVPMGAITIGSLGSLTDAMPLLIAVHERRADSVLDRSSSAHVELRSARSRLAELGAAS